MMSHKLAGLLVLGALALVVGCREQNVQSEAPQPIAMTEEAVGHYCNMGILEHVGPKAQIHLKGIEAPIWFSQVRDGIAFTRSPEEHYEPSAVYVHDMGVAANWERPGDHAWIDADDAWFVIGSTKTGGMGAPEAIPFGVLEKAEAFADENGGTVVRIGDIPDRYVLGPVDISQTTGAVQ